MANHTQRYVTAQRIFGVLFILSIAIFLVLSLLPQDKMSIAGESSSGFPGGVVGVLSLLASITTLVGFVSTTVLEWREERRESRVAELETQRQKLEIEKLRKELDEMRAREED